MKALLDTNFLLIPAQFKVDIYSELANNQLFILDKTIDELKKIQKQQSLKHKKAAKLTLDLIKAKKVKIIKTKKGKVDDLIVEIAKKNKYAVATQDKALKQRLKRQNIKVITLRQKKTIKGNL